MAKDPREGLTPTIARAVLQHLVSMSRDSKKRVKKEALLYVTFDDVKCMAAADRWLADYEIEILELKQELSDVKKRNKQYIEDIQKLERGQK